MIFKNNFNISKAICVNLVLIFASCKARKFGDSSLKKATVISSPEDFNDANYFAKCENELGEIPAVDCTAEGIQINPIPSHTQQSINEQKDGSLNCTNPTVINSGNASCEKARLVMKKHQFNGNSVETSYLCRQAYDGSFKEIAGISYNTHTGNTCFFTSTKTYLETFRAGKAPAPAVSSIIADTPTSIFYKSAAGFEEYAPFTTASKMSVDDRFWTPINILAKSPLTMCGSCHNTKPFIKNQFVFSDFLTEKNSQNKFENAYFSGASGAAAAPVKIVWADKMLQKMGNSNVDTESNEPYWKSFRLAGPAVQQCLSCHNLMSGHRQSIALTQRQNGVFSTYPQPIFADLEQEKRMNVHYALFYNDKGVRDRFQFSGYTTHQAYQNSWFMKLVSKLGDCNRKQTDPLKDGQINCWYEPL